MLLDARPDRIDFRDREFRPRLISLPASYPADQQIEHLFGPYKEKWDMILDQGSEGACTGYGLATVINYLTLYRKAFGIQQAGDIDALINPPSKVSELMLYNAARMYDEWEGEDYSGSSCRGAMKGWHKHGVCAKEYWSPNDDGDDDWARNAARRPLGAYYRVNVQSIADMQAAIYEVGAVYCSASVHGGWFFDELTTEPKPINYNFAADGEPAKKYVLPIIPFSDDERGGHAFALIGYNSYGFILQNSWGPDWAIRWGQAGDSIEHAVGGFAVVTYEDWVRNASDAWVAALAAPMLVDDDARVSRTRTRRSLLAQLAHKTTVRHSFTQPRQPRRWDENKAQEHCVIMGNDGKLTNSRIDAPNAQAGLRKNIRELLKKYPDREIVIFAHGGLNRQDDALRRARILGPWFENNDILPIFIVWRTGFIETVANIGKDFVNEFFPDIARVERTDIKAFFDDLADKAKGKVDRAFEAVAEKIMGKAVWSQMKQNAQAACQHDSARNLTGGMRELANILKDTQAANGDALRIHLLGHSAGALILGHFARDLARFTSIASLGLLAPACTLKFANSTFAPLVRNGQIAPDKFYIANLSRQNERADRVGPYNKSLLYLVSRAFEVPRKTPLLGLDDSWILDCELENDFPSVSSEFGDEPDPFHKAMVLAKLGDYYALTGTKSLADFGDMAQMRLLRQVRDLNNTAAARHAVKTLKLGRITKCDGIHQVLDWRRFKAETGFDYILHRNRNTLVRNVDGKQKYELIKHGNIDNDLNVMNWALSHMKDGNLQLATDLTED